MSKPESDIPLTERDDISEARRDLRWAERALLDAESELDDAIAVTLALDQNN